jgi:hypothetical protein
MGIKYSQSESKELMKKLLANVAVADNITSRLSKGAVIFNKWYVTETVVYQVRLYCGS